MDFGRFWSDRKVIGVMQPTSSIQQRIFQQVCPTKSQPAAMRNRPARVRREKGKLPPIVGRRLAAHHINARIKREMKFQSHPICGPHKFVTREKEFHKRSTRS